MRQKLVVGNWKMHGSLRENRLLLDDIVSGVADLSAVKAAVCVPFPYLAQVEAALSGTTVSWGAQNLSQYEKGAYTGEVSALMLKDFSCAYAIVGHSERRSLFGETSRTVAEKFAAARHAGITPILCVGETLADRESGNTEKVVSEQLEAVIDLLGVESLAASVLAYEPVWAIGTGKTATPMQAQEVHAFLRRKIAENNAAVASKLAILYGGSVKASNAAELFAMEDIDGGLIGGASLVAPDFIGICRAAA